MSLEKALSKVAKDIEELDKLTGKSHILMTLQGLETLTKESRSIEKAKFLKKIEKVDEQKATKFFDTLEKDTKAYINGYEKGWSIFKEELISQLADL